MNNPSSKKRDKQSIYEMFRACRLCGAGGGYKMPIIQNIVDLGDNELKLKEKIKECVQIDVQPDDKMPPLICELCIDKINEFYDFIQLCQLTNTKTRTILGLPLKSSNNNSESDCILGRLSPICHQESDDELLVETKGKIRKTKAEKIAKQVMPKNNQKPEPNSAVTSNSKTVNSKTKTDASKTKTDTSKTKTDASKIKSNTVSNIKTPVYTKRKSEVDMLKEDLLINQSKTKDKVKPRPLSPSPKRMTRKSNEMEESKIKVKDEFNLKRSQVSEKIVKPKVKKRTLSPPPEETIERPKSKRRPLEPSAPSKSTPPLPSKKAKLTQKPPPKPQRKPASPPPSKEYECRICKMKFRSLGGHMKSHDVLYTEMRLSCRPCAEWFTTAEEANIHHKGHKSPDKPYRCQRCCGEFPLIKDYDDHVVDYCPPFFETEPDVKCESCWSEFPTQHMYDEHTCLGEDGRPGGKCSKCKHFYPLLKDLQNHEPTCNRLKYGNILATVKLDVLKSLRGAQIRVAKCDRLLNRTVGDSYDVSRVTPDHDLDKQRVYPYNALHQGLKLKYEPSAVVKIPSLYMEDNHLHWDSHSDTDIDESVAKVKSLSNQCLKIIYTNKLLGKIERKKRIVTSHSEFDEIDEQKDMGTNVDELINNLIDDGVDKKSNVDELINNLIDDGVDKKYDSNDKNEDVDDKNDDGISKSSLEIDISHVGILKDFCVNDSTSNIVNASEINSASENIESQLSDDIKNSEVNDLNVKMDVDEKNDTSLSIETMQENHNSVNNDHGTISTSNGHDITESHDKDDKNDNDMDSTKRNDDKIDVNNVICIKTADKVSVDSETAMETDKL